MDLNKYNLQFLPKDSIAQLPKTWGIYFFLDKDNYPLYIGMSNNLRNRLYSHFRERTEKKYRLISQTEKIGFIITTGFLTTSLLESRLIKDLKPAFNRMLRRHRYLAILEFGVNENGYKIVTAKRERNVSPDDVITGMGIFRSKHQAEGVLQKLQTEYQLCPKLLGLEKGNGACFSYHLKQCSGACTGAIEPSEYNKLFDLIIGEFIVPELKEEIIVQEENSSLKDKLVIKNWTLVKHSSNYLKSILSSNMFEFDNYRIIRTYINSNSYKFANLI